MFAIIFKYFQAFLQVFHLCFLLQQLYLNILKVDRLLHLSPHLLLPRLDVSSSWCLAIRTRDVDRRRPLPSSRCWWHPERREPHVRRMKQSVGADIHTGCPDAGVRVLALSYYYIKTWEAQYKGLQIGSWLMMRVYWILNCAMKFQVKVFGMLRPGGHGPWCQLELFLVSGINKWMNGKKKRPEIPPVHPQSDPIHYWAHMAWHVDCSWDTPWAVLWKG